MTFDYEQRQPLRDQGFPGTYGLNSRPVGVEGLEELTGPERSDRFWLECVKETLLNPLLGIGHRC